MCSSHFYNSFFSSIVVKLNIYVLSKANIYKFHTNFDPTTWRTSRTTSRWRSTTQNFINDWKGLYTIVYVLYIYTIIYNVYVLYIQCILAHFLGQLHLRFQSAKIFQLDTSWSSCLERRYFVIRNPSSLTSTAWIRVHPKLFLIQAKLCWLWWIFNLG